MAKLIAFEYISEDERLLSRPKTLYIDPRKIAVKGDLHKPVWDSVRIGFFRMYGFFIDVDGVEYGSITMNEAQYYAVVGELCCSGARRFRIHVKQFVRSFR